MGDAECPVGTRARGLEHPVFQAGVSGLAILALPCTLMLAASIMPGLSCSWASQLKVLWLFSGTTASLEEKLAHVEKYETVTPHKLLAPRGKRDLSVPLVSSVASQIQARHSCLCCLAGGLERVL